MAKVYIINCPKCGHQFDVMKGILMSEAGLDPIPAERSEGTPFTCSVCGLEMSTQDADFNDHVETIMMVD